ncbi:MAG: glycosyltransferase family 4 protein [Acidimicrobiales bacterium]
MTGPRLLAISHTGLWSGAERVLLRTVAAAADRGWEVTVACPDGPSADRLATAGMTLVGLPELKLPSGPRPLAIGRLATRWLRSAPRIRHFAASADVVLVNGLLGLPPVRLARPKAPVAWLVHDSIHRSEWVALLRLVRSVVDLGVPVSEAVAGALRDAGIRTQVVHNGTDWPVEPATPDPATTIIGCAALLTEWKGQAVLLEAVSRMRHREVVVDLMGERFPKSPDGAYADALEERAAQPDLVGRVRMPGFVDQPQARMRTWTIATSPSIEPEACPLGVLEAMSLGLAVVGTDHGGTPEVLGSTGVLVPPRDPDALAHALDRLIDDEAARISLGAAARDRIAAEFTLAGQTAELLDVLAELARR